MPQSVKKLCGICRRVSKCSALYATECQNALGHMPQSVKMLCGICHKVSKSSAAYAGECQTLCGYAAKCQKALRYMPLSVKTLCGYATKCQNSLRHMPRSVKTLCGHMLQSVKKQCDKGSNALPLYFFACVKRFIALIFCLRYLFYRFDFFSA